jgi:hypothetical protein
MAEINLTGSKYRFGKTYRKDAWWAYPLFVFLALTFFVVYVTWAAWQGKNYWSGPYLSPLYSPELFGPSPHHWFGHNLPGGLMQYDFRPPCSFFGLRVCSA